MHFKFSDDSLALQAKVEAFFRDALVALSRFAVAAGDKLESIDINPFVVLQQGKGAMALDAVLVVRN